MFKFIGDRMRGLHTRFWDVHKDARMVARIMVKRVESCGFRMDDLTGQRVFACKPGRYVVQRAGSPIPCVCANWREAEQSAKGA